MCYCEYHFKKREKKQIAQRMLNVICDDGETEREKLEKQIAQLGIFAQAVQQANAQQIQQMQNVFQQPQSNLGTLKNEEEVMYECK